MTLIAQMKERRLAAMKAKNSLEREILGVALGEVQTAAAREGKDELDDEAVIGVLKKLVKSNREALAATSDAEKQQELRAELEIIETLLPRALGVDEIVAALAPLAAELRAAAGAGPAMGLAMKALKATGATVEAKDVSAAIARMRS
jgi:hypothetical protein